MKHITKIAAGIVAAALIPAWVGAQKPIVYPAKGQSAQQQQKDDGECYVWAKQSTGIDPAVVAQTPPQQQTGPATGGGERVRGAARGAVGGAIIGEIANDDAGKGAGIGAVAGTMAGGRQARQNQAARNQQAQAQQSQTINTYYRAFGACMEGRGYTIK
jgi:YMGG-like Gly-zipper